MTFGSAKEMLDTILQGTDLYSPSNALYVFVYNDEGTSICTYSGMNICKMTNATSTLAHI